MRDQHGVDSSVLGRLEDLAQLLALWRPGAWGKEREHAYLDARFAGVRPNYLYPSMSRVLATTYGQLVYVDQLVAIIKLLGFEHGRAERFRRTIVAGRRAAERNDVERLLRKQKLNSASVLREGAFLVARGRLAREEATGACTGSPTTHGLRRPEPAATARLRTHCTRRSMASSHQSASFRDLLLRYRGRSRLTQRQLAERLGVNRRSVQEWEIGLAYPSTERLENLLRVLLECDGLTSGEQTAEAADL